MSEIKIDLKDQIKENLLSQKRKEQAERILVNSSLIPVTVYTQKTNPACDATLKYFKENGIKFKEEEVTPAIQAIVQVRSVPIISVNGFNLVQGRDFSNPQSCANMLLHVAKPGFVSPPFESAMIEAMKNLGFKLNQQISQIQRQLAPVVKIMNQIAAEDKKDAKKNN